MNRSGTRACEWKQSLNTLRRLSNYAVGLCKADALGLVSLFDSNKKYIYFKLKFVLKINHNALQLYKKYLQLNKKD